MWYPIFFGLCVMGFFGLCILAGILAFEVENERMVPNGDGRGYPGSEPKVQEWDHNLGSLASLHLREDNDNESRGSKEIS